MGTGPLLLPSLNFEPLYYRPHGAGDWSGHVAFAYDLVAALRPAVMVELGTQYGESYFAFCQAIAECGVACKSFAVDTWRGDPHTGAYDEAAFREVCAHNQKHYANFSTLLRTTFDQAAGQFFDASIDLLHIDGLHTYEAVLHDFETWFPKVKAGGIILMHDTQVRQNDFGVWRLWHDLRRRYQSFEFPHSCGLGVIRKPGDRMRPGLISLLFQDADQAEMVRRFYLIAGERLEYKDLAERRRRTGVWELLAKLFWRRAGEGFSEERSIYTRSEVTAAPSSISLDLPCGMSFDQLRIDLLESPDFVRVHALRLLDSHGELVLSVAMKDVQENLVYAGLRFVSDGNGFSVAARLPGEPPAILLSVPEAAVRRLAAGGTLRLEISGLNAEEYASILDSALQEYRNRTLAAESDLAMSHNAAQKVALDLGRELKDLDDRYRNVIEALNRMELAVPDREARILHMEGILAQSREELSRREAQLRDSAAAFNEAQRSIALLEKALCQANEEAERNSSSLRELERKYSDRARRVREIESSLTWRLTRPLRSFPKR
jgi:hypothetical protein